MAKAYLHLADGTRLTGEGFGFHGNSQGPTSPGLRGAGEVVFSTGMTGYVESLTDPSFAGQILTFTYPLIGNYGVPKKLFLDKHLVANRESEHIWVKGVIVGEYAHTPSHFAAHLSLSRWLVQEKIPGIAGIDTRMLTQHIRDHGVMGGVISSKPREVVKSQKAENVVQMVSYKGTVQYKSAHPNGKHVALIDCGVKHGILRELLNLGYNVTRVPWDADPLDVPKIDGIVCSNGPGDPKDCGKTIVNIKKAVDKGVPFLGVCLGHQLLSLAIGADTYKLRFGHRGINQPCLDVTTNKAYVTSQNHGFAVKVDSVPSTYNVWFVNLNDKTIEGIKHKQKNIQSVQFHPEGYPGPGDTKWIFNFLK
jgi:carbamoyl-phosphate synthase small subunit